MSPQPVTRTPAPAPAPVPASPPTKAPLPPGSQGNTSPNMSPAASSTITPRMSETVWMASGLSGLTGWLSPAPSTTSSMDRWGSKNHGDPLPPALPMNCTMLSKVGVYPGKPNRGNEDSGASVEVAGHPGVWLFGVFDGHGPSGAECSRMALEKVIQRLPVQLRKNNNDLNKALSASMVDADTSLHRHRTRTTLSGTTALAGVVSGNKLTVAHVGDSRGVLAERERPGAPLKARQLTIDHTPRVQAEYDRVVKAGGVVLTVDQIDGVKDKNAKAWGPEFGNDGDPPRVWAPGADWPGTAFTRSLGDRVAKTLGVICVPEITTVEVDPATTPFAILASDGVWEFLSPQQAVDIIASTDDRDAAIEKLLETAYEAWMANEPRSDDITAIVIYFGG